MKKLDELVKAFDAAQRRYKEAEVSYLIAIARAETALDNMNQRVEELDQIREQFRELANEQ